MQSSRTGAVEDYAGFLYPQKTRSADIMAASQPRQYDVILSSPPCAGAIPMVSAVDIY